MKIVIVGDLHLRGKKLKDISAAWASAVNWAHTNGADLIVQAGDVFDHANVYGREASTGTVYEALLAPFCTQEKALPLVVIPGNHDIGSPKDKDALAPIDKYNWISVVRKPCLYVVNDQLAICAVPWLNRIHLISSLLAKGMKSDEATKKVDTVIKNLMVPLAKETKKQQDEGRFVLFVGHLEVTGAQREGGTVQSEGSFEFAPADLCSVGANAYALAHIHIRQHVYGMPNPNDGYIGSLCQLSYGEEGNSVGCRLIEIKDRAIVVDKWLDNKTSPKYFTVNSLTGLDYRPAHDFVKLRGDNRPDTLPEGIIFERLPQAAESRKRLEDKLTCDMPLRTLLAAWKSVSRCPIDLDRLVDAAEKLWSTNQTHDEAIGSIERVNRLMLRNLTCHTSTEIDLSFSGICGLAGPNGSGKTTAIEAIMLNLYGLSPSRPLIPTLIPRGDTVESASEMEFVSGGKTYIARREFKKTPKTFGHKGYVFEKGSKNPLAGPKVEDVLTFCTGLVGDPDLVLAGIFSSQGDAGNLVKLKPAARKDLFAKLLGSEKYFVLSEAAKKIVGGEGAAIQVQKGRIESLKIELATEQDDEREVRRLGGEVENKQQESNEARALVDATNQAMQSIEGLKKERDAIVSRLASLEKKKLEVQTEGRELKRKKTEIEALDSSKIIEELEEVRQWRDKLDEIRNQIEQARQRESTAKTIVLETKAKITEILRARDKAWNQYVREATEKRHAIKAVRDEEKLVILGKMQELKNRKAVAEEGLAEAQRRTGLLKGFPDLDACRTCPLAADSIASRDSIPELEERIKKIVANLAKGEAKLAEHEKETVQIIADSPVPVEMENWEQNVNYNVSDLEQEVVTQTRIAENCVPPSLLKEESAAKAKVVRLGELEAQLDKINAAKAEIAKLDALLEAARKNFKALDEEIKGTQVPEFPEEEYSQKKLKLESAKATAAFKNNELSSLNIALGKAQARLEQHAVRKTEIVKLEAEIKGKSEKIEVYEALTQAFCRDGIPQLIVDSTIPHLEDIMFDLMSDCDGRWTIRIATQRETKSGALQERIDILVDDGNDERDIATYSGGEMNLLSVIVRAAFSILQSERSGKGLKVLVLDEAMFFADGDQAESFVRMVKKLPRYFNQIFVVSHSEAILSSIQNKIYFVRNSNGESTVQTAFTADKND